MQRRRDAQVNTIALLCIFQLALNLPTVTPGTAARSLLTPLPPTITARRHSGIPTGTLPELLQNSVRADFETLKASPERNIPNGRSRGRRRSSAATQRRDLPPLAVTNAPP